MHDVYYRWGHLTSKIFPCRQQRMKSSTPLRGKNKPCNKLFWLTPYNESCRKVMDRYFPRSHLKPILTFDSITTLTPLDSGLIILFTIYCVFITELQGCYEGLWDESISPLSCVLLRNTIVVGVCCLPYQKHPLSIGLAALVVTLNF